MNNLIIGCADNYNWDKLKFWINSINQSGFVGSKVLVLMNCDAETLKKVTDSGFFVIGFNKDQQGNLVYESRMPVHVERFLHIYNVLRDNEFDYVITTDVRDVVFQHDPFPSLIETLSDEGTNLIVSSESILYKNEPWGDNNLLETFGPYFHKIFRENEIYNVGVLAGKGSAIRDLACMIFNMSVNRPIPIVDQSTFNMMISLEPYRSTTSFMKSEDGWACQLGTTVDPMKIDSFKPHLLEDCPVMRDELVVTNKNNKEYAIVHQYDRVPVWKNIIEKKYS